MEKSKIIFHSLVNIPDDFKAIEQMLRGVNNEISFIVDTKESLEINGKNLEIVMLEPKMSQWEWLDVIISIAHEHPLVPVILYSNEIMDNRVLFSISEHMQIFVANSRTVVAEIVDKITRARGSQEKTIMFVDDDTNILKSYIRVLRKTPWKVLIASSGEEALEILENKRIDLLFTDIKMPNMHGVELISIVRKKDAKIPIIICSAYNALKDDQNIKFHNISAFLEKPIDPETLKHNIEKFIQSKNSI
jgi:DNA-binding NtrC family response regulator